MAAGQGTTAAGKSQLESAAPDPKEAAKLAKAIKSKEIAPTTADTSPIFADWQQQRDALGQPFDFERMTMRHRRVVRLDPMIAFGLHYRKVPMARANFHIDARDKNGPNAQVAGFLDSAWRKIHARYVLQHWLAYDFGFQAIAQRFIEENPGGVYEDKSEADATKRVKPVWDEGSVMPVIWKPFVTLDPSRVQPVFNDATGEFDGILYDIPPSQRRSRGGVGGGRSGQGGNQNQINIDVYRSLWVTNERDKVLGSIYGFPRTQHAFRYWWSYWYNWAQRDRAFERMAVPPLVAYHPEGNYRDPDTGEETPNQQVALNAAASLRANAIAAVPSTLQSAGLEERGTTQREWEFKFLETPTTHFDTFNEAFNYLDVMKLRSIWIPEQAFIDSPGGSGKNVATQMAEIFIESLALDWDEMADHINRYIFPQLLVTNFPEFVNNGGTARIIGHGFDSDDIELLKQLVQLVGQADPLALGVDIREALRRLNVPLKDPAEMVTDAEQIAAAQGAGQPPAVTPAPGQVGTTTFNPGSTNGGSVPEPNAPGTAVAAGNGAAVGFSDDEVRIYVDPQEHITLSAESDFLASLPDSKHYSDKAMKALAVQLRKIWAGHFRGVYTEFAKWIVAQPITLSDDELAEIELADQTPINKATKIANKLIKAFTFDSQRLTQVTTQSSKVISRMLKRAVGLEQKNANNDVTVDQDAFDEFLESQIGLLIKRTHETVKDELRNFLVNSIRDGQTTQEISAGITEHFNEFPSWKANRVARSEVRDAVNAGTLLTAAAAKERYTRAHDGTDFDEDCKKRDGKLYTIREAWNEMRKEHSNGTLGFERLQRANLSIEWVHELPEEAPEGAVAFFDEKTDTAFMWRGIDGEDADKYLSALGARLEREPAMIAS